MKNTLLLLLALFCVPFAAAKPPADLQARLDLWIKGQPGGVAVAWVDADGAAFFQAGKYSEADPRTVTPDTQFELGSITKVFTALLLAESERLGQVSRHDPAAKFLLPADDPAQAALAKITLLSLTTHTSGLPRLPSNLGLKPQTAADPYAAYDRAMLINALKMDGPPAPTGRAMVYSNFGVAVLGEALAAAWGTSYADALRVHVLAPLGMHDTTLGLVDSPVPSNLAPGHVEEKPVPNWTFQAVAPAGALRSSARDMAIFISAFLDKKGALRPSFEATVQSQHADPGFTGHIGLGWFLTDDVERPVVWHGGATAGSHALLAISPKTSTGVVILANVQQVSEALGFSLLGLGDKWPQYQHPKGETVKDTAGYVGLYPLSPAFAIAITAKDNALFGQATGQPQFALRPITADRFAIMGVPAEISFERGADGKVVALVLHQNGRDQRAPRGELPPAPKEIALPVETLREYVGQYPLTPQFVLTVTETDGALFVQATGQGNFPVFATAKDEFFYKIVDARLTFQRDAPGRITGLVLHQGGRDMPAMKSK